MQANQRALAGVAAARDRRSGVAIIVVLGVVALLMLLGVAFSITMRIERTGAGNFAQQVATRQLIGAAVAAAMEAVDASMASGSTNFLYPSWNVLPSTGGGDAARLAWGRALDYIPGSLVTAARDGGERWMEIATSAGGTAGYGAFLVINESGLVDANLAGGAARYAGVDPGELSIALFPSVQNTNALENTRLDDVRYETLAEFNVLQDGHGLDGPSDYFSVYSRAPRGVLLADNTVRTDQVYLGTLAEIEADQVQIIQALVASGIAPSRAQVVYRALLDYVDEDSVPRDLNWVNAEAVPLINELGARAALQPTATPEQWRTRARIYLETAYLYAEPSAHTFSVTGQVTTVVFADDVEIERFGPDPLAIPPLRVAVDYSQPYRVGFQDTEFHTFNAPSNAVVRLRYVVQADVLIGEASGSHPAGTVVDRVNHNSFYVEAEPVSLLAVGGGWNRDVPSREAIDPRFNWASQGWWPSNAAYPTPPERTLPHTLGDFNIGARNETTHRRITVDRNEPYDWHLKRHVSNAGRIISVGELGYLPLFMLESVRLTDSYVQDPGPPASWQLEASRHRVLDYFTSDQDAVASGRVSLNTLNGPVLQALLREVPVDYLGSGQRLGNTDADNLAGAIWDWRMDTAATNVFRNVSDIGRLNWRAIPGFDVAAKSDHEIESIIAHSDGLLTTRQNLFTVLVAARTFRVGVGVVAEAARAGTFLADERAIVQLWRDPFPVNVAPAGSPPVYKHNWRVEYFRWLGGE